MSKLFSLKFNCIITVSRELKIKFPELNNLFENSVISKERTFDTNDLSDFNGYVTSDGRLKSRDGNLYEVTQRVWFLDRESRDEVFALEFEKGIVKKAIIKH